MPSAEKEGKMRNVKILCAAFLTVLAFGAVSAVAANALQWLGNNAAINVSTGTTTKGTWTLAMKSFGGFIETEINCTGTLLESVKLGGGKAIEIEDTKSHRGGNGTKLECTVGAKNGACNKGEVAIVEPINLPWVSTLIMGGAMPTDSFTGEKLGAEPGFTVSCNGVKDTCEGKFRTDELVNEGAPKLGVSAKVLGSKSEKCTELGSQLVLSSSVESVFTLEPATDRLTAEN
ncbi:MAG: hypothetical protein ACTHM1_02405 [Solirubrobacteraceae bacterium]